MRVLLVHNRYRTLGGEERHLDLLEDGLVRAGVDVERYEVTSPEQPHLDRRVAVAAGLPYRLSSRRAIADVLRTRRPDVVHAHNLMPLLTPSVLHEARRNGARVVLTAHNYRLFCPAGTLLRRGHVHDDCVAGSSLVCGFRGARDSRLESVAYGLTLELHRRFRLIQRWVDAIVVPSAYLGETLRRAGFPGDRIHLVRLGLPVDGWAPRSREHGLYAGRLSPEKGLDVLLEAARRAGIPLRIAGDGPMVPQVRAAAAGDLEYLGLLSADELATVRRRAAFVVVPSVWADISPFAALEALADGTPVIASRIGGLTEIVDDPRVGTIVPPGDPVALAAAMLDWWRRRDAADVGRAAWERARERYELERQTRQIIGLYRSVLESA